MSAPLAPSSDPGEHAGSTDTPDPAGWIGHKTIAGIPGALKPSAYVARAYHHQQEHGAPPPWARKLESGRWLFDARYVQADAALNNATVGVSEAARQLGVTRRAVQTWVDEGRLPTTLDRHEKGAVRRIDRAAFLRLLPDLRARLQEGIRGRTPAVPPATSAAPVVLTEAERLRRQLQEEAEAEERRLTAEFDRRQHELDEAHRTLARDRQKAERRLQALAQAEQRARAREAKLRHGYQSRLEQAHQQTREMDRLRASAEREAQRTARREAHVEAQASRLLNRFKQQLESWRQRSAELIARQLQDARQAWQKPTPGPGQQDAARRSAAAVASQLHRARDQAQAQRLARTQAIEIADTLKAEIASGSLDRYDAAIRFHTLTEQKQIPEEIRVEVMRRYFSGQEP